MKIAIDAMGGDYGAAIVVEGAVSAACELNVDLILVGDENVISAEMEKYDCQGGKVEIVHASQRVEMDEAPANVRRKKDSSIWIGTELVKEKKAAAIISAGNTGAAMATGLFQLGTLQGVERPAIAAFVPNLKGSKTIIVDAGANVDCKPKQLCQFAVMGYEYAKAVLEHEQPTIGLLSIGEEDGKGNELTRDTFKLLKDSGLNFTGNVEGRDIFSGQADVVVCDGFIGNVVIKVSEGLVDAVSKSLRKEIESSLVGRAGALLLKSSFRRFKGTFDYAEYGGAPLIGLNGVSIICHGSSSPKAIKNAIRLAKKILDNRINEHIQEDIEQNLFVSDKGD